MPVFTPLQMGKLLDLAKQNRVAPVYLYIGPPEITLDKAKEMYSVLLEKGSPFELFDLRDQEQKRDFLRTRGFQEGLFGTRKVYVIIGGEEIPDSKVEEIIKPFREEKNFFTWFILTEKIEERSPLYKFALEKGAIIPFSTKKREDLFESELWMALKDANLSMEKKTASLFLSLVGEDYHHFKNELEKLLLYCMGEKTITENKIFEITVPREDRALYLLGDLLFKEDPEKILKFFHALLDNKRDPSEILAYLYRYFKRLRILQEFLQENPQLAKEVNYSSFTKVWQTIKEDPLKEIPKTLIEMHPYALYNAKELLKRISNLDIPFYLLYEAELELKKDFKSPYKVFQNFVFNLWRSVKRANLN
ncbi:MAG: hypothetical protein N2Z40_03310 [Caldimicrobium sp.]|nr:hypothetical protein [Caldimicrobium sp.]MCX7613236.1 hypothetical protein [Caldimicrobium sp.]MDW8182081.1 hypothetical protein [Caldimicrobium sp.]